MSAAPVELRVGGQTYRVVASAEEEALRRYAEVVDQRLSAVTLPGRQISPQALVLAAISLAHDLEEERARRRQLEQRSREVLNGLLGRIDRAVSAVDAVQREAAQELAHGEQGAPHPKD